MVNLVLVLAACLLGVMLTEVALRIVGSVRGIDYRLYGKELTNSQRLPKSLFRQDPDLGVSLAPGTQVLATTSDFSVVYRINQRGLRDRDYDLDKPPGRHRIIALGDSFTFGEGIPYGKRFSDLMEESLPDIDVITMAVPGYGIDQEIALFARDGLAYGPDQVILFINRVDTYRVRLKVAKDGHIRLPDPGADTAYLQATDPFFRQAAYWGLGHSQLFGLLSYWNRLRELRERMKNTDRQVWERPTLKVGMDSQSPGEDRNPVMMRRTKALVTQLLDLCRTSEIQLRVVNIDPNFTMDFLREIEGLKFTDFSKELSDQAKRYPLRFTYDRHFNERTNAFLAEKIQSLLQTEDLPG